MPYKVRSYALSIIIPIIHMHFASTVECSSSVWSGVMKFQLAKLLKHSCLALQKLQTCCRVVLMVRNSGPRARQLMDPMWFHFRHASYRHTFRTSSSTQSSTELRVIVAQDDLSGFYVWSPKDVLSVRVDTQRYQILKDPRSLREGSMCGRDLRRKDGTKTRL